MLADSLSRFLDMTPEAEPTWELPGEEFSVACFEELETAKVHETFIEQIENLEIEVPKEVMQEVKVPKDITVATSTSQPMIKNDEVRMEEILKEHTSRINMVDKLVQAANNLENKVRNEENIKIPAIDLLLQIQAALDERQVFPENNTVNILEIINRIPDKSVLVCQEKLNGEMIDSHQAKAPVDSLSKESKAKE